MPKEKKQRELLTVSQYAKRKGFTTGQVYNKIYDKTIMPINETTKCSYLLIDWDTYKDLIIIPKRKKKESGVSNWVEGAYADSLVASSKP